MTERELVFEDFNSRVNRRFTMLDEHERASEITLVECSQRPADDPRSFTLLFRGAPDGPAVQGMYLLSADDFEPAPVFLVPVARTSDGVDYHAVFNHYDGG
jgi:hypothetical protein